MDNHTSLVSNSDQIIVRRISASPSGLVERYATWTVNKNLRSVMPLDDKTSRVFKALGGKAGTHDIIPEQFRDYKNVCNVQLQLIHSESDHIIVLEHIVEKFDMDRARLVLPDTMAEKGHGRVFRRSHLRHSRRGYSEEIWFE